MDEVRERDGGMGKDHSIERLNAKLIYVKSGGAHCGFNDLPTLSATGFESLQGKKSWGRATKEAMNDRKCPLMESKRKAAPLTVFTSVCFGRKPRVSAVCF